MPKTNSKLLFELIKKLSGSEKRHFKLMNNHLLKAEPPKYLQLFDLIDKSKVYNEEKLKLKIYGSAEVTGKKFTVLKSYLYDFILTSLQQYDQDDSVEYKLSSMMLNIRGLYKRGMYVHGLQIINKAKKLASKYELPTFLIRILDWERKIKLHLVSHKQYMAAEPDHRQEILTSADQIKRTIVLKGIFNQLIVLRQWKNLRTVMSDPEWANTLKLVSTNSDELRSIEEKMNLNRILAIRAAFERAPQKTYFHQRKLVEILENNKLVEKENPFYGIASINNFVNSCISLKRFEEAAEYNERLLKKNAITEEDKYYKRYFYVLNQLQYLVRVARFKEAKKELEAFIDFPQQFGKEISINLQFIFTQVYLGLNNHEKALEWNNQMLYVRNKELRKDLLSMGRMLNLMIHFDLHNFILIDSLLRSTKYFLKSAETLMIYEQKMLRAFRRLIQTPEKKKQLEIFRKVRSELQKLIDEKPRENIYVEAIYLIPWLDSKIKNKKIAQTIKEEYEALYLNVEVK